MCILLSSTWWHKGHKGLSKAPPLCRRFLLSANREWMNLVSVICCRWEKVLSALSCALQLILENVAISKPYFLSRYSRRLRLNIWVNIICLSPVVHISPPIVQEAIVPSRMYGGWSWATLSRASVASLSASSFTNLSFSQNLIRCRSKCFANTWC